MSRMVSGLIGVVKDSSSICTDSTTTNIYIESQQLLEISKNLRFGSPSSHIPYPSQIKGGTLIGCFWLEKWMKAVWKD